jgi:hypothetical protein
VAVHTAHSDFLRAFSFLHISEAWLDRADSQGDPVTLEEFAAKLQEFRAVASDKATKLQVESLIETLEEEPEDGEEAEEGS